MNINYRVIHNKMNIIENDYEIAFPDFIENNVDFYKYNIGDDRIERGDLYKDHVDLYRDYEDNADRINILQVIMVGGLLLFMAYMYKIEFILQRQTMLFIYHLH